MAREALTWLSSSSSTYCKVKAIHINVRCFKEAINGLFDTNLSIYTYSWYEEGRHNLDNLSCVHDIKKWTYYQHGMNWNSSNFTLIRCHFAPPQDLSIWTNRYLQSIYTSTLIQERSASGRPLIHREGHNVTKQSNLDYIEWSITDMYGNEISLNSNVYVSFTISVY